MAIGILLALVLALMWLVMAAPIGLRTISRTFVVQAPIERIRGALHPFGADFCWNEAVSAVTPMDASRGHVVTTHTDRAGGFIEREFEIIDSGDEWSMRFTNDTSLAQNFWADHVMRTSLKSSGADTTVVSISETDRYRGIAFYVFRYFATRRTSEKLKIWAKDGSFQRGGIFEKPITQFGMAVASAVLLWPIFGISLDGFIMASLLTAIVALHELGHVVAFRMMGHQHARMIFIPILGGIAMGGRPYDKHFEIGFSALMGAGFSAFLMAFVMWAYSAFGQTIDGNASHYVLIFALFGALFNLGNLIPVWKFDGGQVLRQVFRSRVGLSIGAFILLSWFALIGAAMSVPINAMLLVGAVFAGLSIMTSKGGIKPKNPLTPMTPTERGAILAAFAAVFSIHGSVLIWSAGKLFA